MIRKFLFLVFLVLLNTTNAQVIISVEADELDLTPSLRYFMESDSVLTKDMALKRFESGDFIQSTKKGALNFGSHSPAVWLYVTVESEETIEKILHFACVDIYVPDDRSDEFICDYVFGFEKVFEMELLLHVVFYFDKYSFGYLC